jgi:hypothetical protein
MQTAGVCPFCGVQNEAFDESACSSFVPFERQGTLSGPVSGTLRHHASEELGWWEVTPSSTFEAHRCEAALRDRARLRRR